MLDRTTVMETSEHSARYLNSGLMNYDSSREDSIRRPSVLDMKFLTHDST